jgi:N-acyl-phosphatidylethanolamine-hydrolysing phospholipase D
MGKKESKIPFVNPHVKQIRRSLWDLILWTLGYYDDPTPPPLAPDSFVYPVPDLPCDLKKPYVLWVNHSTFLIHIDGIHILTDPIWSKRCSPLPFLGPKRRHPTGLTLENLPKIDYVLISHNHYDHLDKKTVARLAELFPEIRWMVPSGVKKWFENLKIDNVTEFSWWEERQFSNIKVVATPSQHFSGRRGYDVNRTLWVGFVIECGGKRFYFVGDTGYNPYDFKQIGEKWKSMDLSLIPIGSYLPRSFMSPVHIEPKDALRIHEEVGSKLSIGMHWKTFRLSDEPFHQPPYDLFLALKQEGIDPATFLVLEPGHAINW